MYKIKEIKSGKFQEKGIPKIEKLAKELFISKRYLSDTLNMIMSKWN